MNYKVGEIVEGKVTGIQPYGAFIMLNNHVSGLIHISEISDGYVKDIHQFIQVGDTIKVKIIDIDEENKQVRLSLKAANLKRVHFNHSSILRSASLPEAKLGFTTVEKQLPEWIKQAKEQINHDEI